MKILFVTPRLPYPPIKGDRLRTYHFIREISKAHTVDICSFYENNKERIPFPELNRYCRKVFLTALNPLNVLRSIWNAKPMQVNYYYSNAMKNLIKRIIQDEQYDIVHLVLDRMMEYSKIIGKDKIFLDKIDALSLNMQRRALTERNIIKKVIFSIEYNRMKNYEKFSRLNCAKSIITSQIDKCFLNDALIEVVPNGVDTDFFHTGNCQKDIDLLFTGNMGYFPNIDAMEYFYNSILPIIQKTIPHIKTYIVGTNPSYLIKKLQTKCKNIIVTGHVNDIRMYLHRAMVFIAPLRSGSGIQNKILEAMASGLPVVSTTYGNSGIQAESENTLFIADNPEHFAQLVIRLLQNQQLRDKIGMAARNFVIDSFCWSAQTKRIELMYESLIKDKLQT